MSCLAFRNADPPSKTDIEPALIHVFVIIGGGQIVYTVNVVDCVDAVHPVFVVRKDVMLRTADLA